MPLLARLGRDITTAMQDADVIRRPRDAGSQAPGGDATGSACFVRDETDRRATLVTEAQIRPDA